MIPSVQMAYKRVRKKFNMNILPLLKINYIPHVILLVLTLCFNFTNFFLYKLLVYKKVYLLILILSRQPFNSPLLFLIIGSNILYKSSLILFRTLLLQFLCRYYIINWLFFMIQRTYIVIKCCAVSIIRYIFISGMYLVFKIQNYGRK